MATITALRQRSDELAGCACSGLVLSGGFNGAWCRERSDTNSCESSVEVHLRSGMGLILSPNKKEIVISLGCCLQFEISVSSRFAPRREPAIYAKILPQTQWR
jgi:hypothetical protein